MGRAQAGDFSEGCACATSGRGAGGGALSLRAFAGESDHQRVSAVKVSGLNVLAPATPFQSKQCGIHDVVFRRARAAVTAAFESTCERDHIGHIGYGWRHICPSTGRLTRLAQLRLNKSRMEAPSPPRAGPSPSSTPKGWRAERTRSPTRRGQLGSWPRVVASAVCSRQGRKSSSSSTTYPAVDPSEKVTMTPSSPSGSAVTILMESQVVIMSGYDFFARPSVSRRTEERD